jgi:hypothetical protein
MMVVLNSIRNNLLSYLDRNIDEYGYRTYYNYFMSYVS